MMGIEPQLKCIDVKKRKRNTYSIGMAIKFQKGELKKQFGKRLWKKKK